MDTRPLRAQAWEIQAIVNDILNGDLPASIGLGAIRKTAAAIDAACLAAEDAAAAAFVARCAAVIEAA